MLTLGCDRDNDTVSHIFDERDLAVRRSVKHLIDVAHSEGKTVSICGQAPSVYPEFAEFLVRSGIDSMKIENRSFPEAVKFLAGKLNIPIPEQEKNPAELAREMQAKEVYAANELAARFFQSCLINTEYGKTGVEYLAARGITREIIDGFALGMAPPDYNKLHLALERKGISEDTIIKAGLANKRDNGGIYDRFRARIMIPIRDVRGRVVGFTGRILNKDIKEAKYMNTGETEWFSKRNILFGLDTALKSIKEHKQVVLVEGHMDAISLHEQRKSDRHRFF